MIKIPGTVEGAPAVKQCLSEGININITLLFSQENHERVMWAYIEALEERLAAQQPVSRVDTLIDKQLEQKIEATSDIYVKAHMRGLLGKTGIANA